ncbi:MAG: ABC transporter substrate-binding protein [Pseudonocardiaceae bacterium]
MSGPTLRRLVAAAALGALALGAAACGGSGSTEASTEQRTTRTIEHAMGRTEVPVQPERVVVLDTGEFDAVTALGVKPVGAVRAPADSGFLEYLSDEARGVELVGTIAEPNLEKIASLRPDLILSSKLRHEEFYDELSGIAPTVFAETVGVVWKENFLLDARALGMEGKARRMLDGYEQRAAQLGSKIGDPAATSVSLVRFTPDQIRLYAKGSFIGTVLDDVGFSRPPSQQPDETFVEVSAEQIAQADGDVIFVSSYGPAAETGLPSVTAGPLWQTLGAVEAGKVQLVPDDHWMLGIGIGAAQLVLDDLEAHFLR